MDRGCRPALIRCSVVLLYGVGMAERPERLDSTAFEAQYQLPGWAVADEHLVGEFRVGSYRAAAALIGAIRFG